MGPNKLTRYFAEVVFTSLFLFVIFGATSKWGNSTMAGLAAIVWRIIEPAARE
jgi:aquaporin Z